MISFRWLGLRDIRKKYWNITKNVIQQCSVVLEVLDARDAWGTKNYSVEKWAGRSKLVLVITKSDLIKGEKKGEVLERFKGYDIVFFSSKKRQGKKLLIDMIRRKTKRRPIKVGVVGYPNVGKSSLINQLKGRRSAPVANVPGKTKNIQWLRIAEDIMLMDTPGVIPRGERSQSLLLKAAISPDRLKNPEDNAARIIDEFREKGQLDSLSKLYDVDLGGAEDSFEAIEKIAERKGLLLKGGELNTFEAAKHVIRDFQKGRLVLA